MIRKYVFLGLMVVLVGALVSLVVSGRRQEEAGTKTIPHEIIRSSPATAVHMLAPSELRVTDVGPGAVMQITNSGGTLFHHLLLKVTYFDRRGHELETRDVSVDQPIRPGETVTVEGPSATDAPAGSVRRTVRVAYGETSEH